MASYVKFYILILNLGLSSSLIRKTDVLITDRLDFIHRVTWATVNDDDDDAALDSRHFEYFLSEQWVVAKTYNSAQVSLFGIKSLTLLMSDNAAQHPLPAQHASTQQHSVRDSVIFHLLSDPLKILENVINFNW